MTASEENVPCNWRSDGKLRELLWWKSAPWKCHVSSRILKRGIGGSKSRDFAGQTVLLKIIQAWSKRIRIHDEMLWVLIRVCKLLNEHVEENSSVQCSVWQLEIKACKVLWNNLLPRRHCRNAHGTWVATSISTWSRTELKTSESYSQPKMSQKHHTSIQISRIADR